MSISAALLLLGACGPREGIAPSGARAGTHVPTPIPIDINTLTPAQQGLIREANAADPTPYLMRSRPIVFQIVETGNDADEVRRSGPLTERAEVLVYALGEAEGERLVDRGWIEDRATGERIWEMRFAETEHAGGDPRNRKAVERLWLAPGEYDLRYVSNASHAFGHWRGAPPERELFYGIVVFNLAGIEALEARLRQAGSPLDRPDVRGAEPPTRGS